MKQKVSFLYVELNLHPQCRETGYISWNKFSTCLVGTRSTYPMQQVLYGSLMYLNILTM